MATIADVDACADRLVQLALRAGGGDNITVVLADVVELDDVADGEGPTTNATVVGAAALTRNDPTAAADGPAARAAGLARAAQAADDDAQETTPAAAVDGRRRGAPDEPARRWRSVVVWLGVAAVVVGAGLVAYSWTQTQYYVGVDDDEVVIFRGLPQTPGPDRAVVRRSSAPARRSTTSTRATCGSASSRPSTPTPSTTPATWSRCSRTTPTPVAAPDADRHPTHATTLRPVRDGHTVSRA